MGKSRYHMEENRVGIFFFQKKKRLRLIAFLVAYQRKYIKIMRKLKCTFFCSHFIDSVFSVCIQGRAEKTPNTMSIGFSSKNLVLKVNFVKFHAHSDGAPHDFIVP